jgi:hypothetical protein
MVNRNNEVDLQSITTSKMNDRKRNNKDISGESSKKRKTDAPNSAKNTEMSSSVVNNEKDGSNDKNKHKEVKEKSPKD